MAITTVDGIANALGNNATRLLMDKASIANAAAGQFHSLWRATGQPGQGAIPTAAAVPNHATTGAFNFAQQTAPAKSYMAWMAFACSNSGGVTEIHDRLMHMGGLNGTLNTAQTVNLDLDANLATNNLDARKGDANFSDVSWWLEWFTDTGGTAVTATVNVTYNDGTSANLTALSLAATRRASFMAPLNSLVPAADAGKFIRDVNTVQLSATTGTAGNFGVTATRQRAVVDHPLANKTERLNWADIGFNEIYNQSCLFPIVMAVTTNTGTNRGQAKIAHG